MAGRLATVSLFILSSAMVFMLETAQDNFNIMLQVGAGTGLLYLLRWFWWRITAWCEIVAMSSSFAVSIGFLFLHKNGIRMGTHQELLLSIAITTVCWLIVAYVGPQTNKETLVNFYKKVRPLGPGWKDIRIAAGVSEAEAREFARHDNIPLALVGWVTGSLMIWSALFTVGNFLYGRLDYATGLLGLCLLSTATVVGVVRRIWK
jgi:hypothetical protein